MARNATYLNIKKDAFKKALTPQSSNIDLPLAIFESVNTAMREPSKTDKYYYIDKDYTKDKLSTKNYFSKTLLTRDKRTLRRRLFERFDSKEEIIMLSYSDFVSCLCYVFVDVFDNTHTKEDLKDLFKSIVKPLVNSNNIHKKGISQLNRFFEVIKTPETMNGVFPKVNKDFKLVFLKREPEDKQDITEKEFPYFSVKHFLSNGDYVSALNMSHKKREGLIPIPMVLEYIEICQKYGLLKEVERKIELSEQRILNSANNTYIGRMRLVELKKESQYGNSDAVISNFSKVEVLLKHTDVSIRLCSANLRLAVAYARKNNKSKCFESIKRAEMVLQKHQGNESIKHIILFYKVIISAFSGVELISNHQEETIKCQFGYFDNPNHDSDKIKYQTNPLQVLSQRLFTEACIYLTKTKETLGDRVLLAANILCSRARCNEKSEGFAELLQLLPEGLQNVVRRAMNPDDLARRKFQTDEIDNLSDHLKKLQHKIVPLYNNYTKENWEELRKCFII